MAVLALDLEFTWLGRFYSGGSIGCWFLIIMFFIYVAKIGIYGLYLGFLSG